MIAHSSEKHNDNDNTRGKVPFFSEVAGLVHGFSLPELYPYLIHSIFNMTIAIGILIFL